MIPFEKQKALWQALSRGLVRPDESWFDAMESLMEDALAAGMDRELSLALERWKESLGALKAAPLEEAQYEYTRLFVNGYPKAACPPYESVYREGTMLGDSALDVHRVYADWGLEMAANEAGDHLAVMLEFLYYLSSLLDMAEDDEQRRAVEEAIGEFWKEHVGSWLPRFSRDLEENAEMPFYARMGQVFSRVASLMS